MPIDWNKVGESAVLMVPTALVSVWIGARVKAHLDRAKPHISVTGFRIGKGSDLVVSRVAVPASLSAKLRENTWTPALYGEVNTAKLVAAGTKLKQALSEAGDAIAFLEASMRELASVSQGSTEQKIAFLDTITEPQHRIINAAFTGALVRQDLRLPLPSDGELGTMPRVVEFVERTEESGGYFLNLRTAWYSLRYRDKRDNPYLLPAAKAMAYFHEPSIRQMLAHALTEITKLAATGSDILRQIEQLTEQAVPLIVEVRITNGGRSSVLFAPWALLEVTHPNSATQDIKIELVRSMTYWKPDDPVEAAKQEAQLIELPEVPMDQDNYFLVDAGRSTKMIYRSQLPVNQLTATNRDLLDVMKLEIFKCQVHLRRADVRTPKRAWVHSALATFGTKAEQFPKAESATAVAATWLTRKWWAGRLRRYFAA